MMLRKFLSSAVINNSFISKLIAGSTEKLINYFAFVWGFYLLFPLIPGFELFCIVIGALLLYKENLLSPLNLILIFLLALISLGSTFFFLLENPSNYIQQQLISPYGVGYVYPFNIIVYALSLVTLVLLVTNDLYFNKNSFYENAPQYFLLVTLFLFTLSAIINNSISNQMNLNSLFFPAALVYFFSSTNYKSYIVDTMLKVLYFIGFVLSIAIIIQHIVHDYSYILPGFYRVRASYYYHASATYIVASILFVRLNSIIINKSFNRHDALYSVLLTVSILLNSTRAISFAITAAVIITCLFYAKKIKKIYYIYFFLGLLTFIYHNIYYSKGSMYVQNNEIFKTVNVSLNTPNYIEDYQKDNEYRSELFKIDSEMKNIFFGSGLGSVIKTHKVSGKIKNEISTHSFLLDIFNGCGVLALIAIFIWLFIAPFKAISNLVKFNFRAKKYKLIDFGSSEIHKEPIINQDINLIIVIYTSLSTLAYFIITSFFFPKEQGFSISVTFFFIAYISTLSDKMKSTFKGQEKLQKLSRTYRTTLCFFMLLYCVVSSPSYILPIAQAYVVFKKNNSSVFDFEIITNSQILKEILSVFSIVSGQRDSRIRVIQNQEDLAKKSNFVLFWSPYIEFNDNYQYDNKIEIAPYPKYGYWDLLNVPANFKRIRLYLTPISVIFSSKENLSTLNINEINEEKRSSR